MLYFVIIPRQMVHKKKKTKQKHIPFIKNLCIENKPVTRTGPEGSLRYVYTHIDTKKKL